MEVIGQVHVTGALPPWKAETLPIKIRGLVGLWASLDVLEKTIISCLCWELYIRQSSPWQATVPIVLF
jgi:hypothetical protein